MTAEAHAARLFHGFIAVAPLKPTKSTATFALDHALFHGSIAVAPLKQCCWRLSLRVAALPRLHRRGPIEAAVGRRHPSCRVLFHGFIAVAPLKPAR